MVSSDASLTRSTAGGIAWSVFGTVATAGLQIIYTAVMSRLLEPADFGLVAAALIGLRFVTYVSRFGLGSAVTQREHLSADDTSVALRLSVATGVVSAAGAIALSPLLASVVGEPSSAPVMRWLGLSLLLGSLLMVPEAILRRRLAFRALAGAQVVSFAVGYLGVGISMAVAGAGVWSLVGATLAQALSLLLIVMAIARPAWRGQFSRTSARGLLSFGGAVTLTGFLEFVAGSVDTIAVGRWVGAFGLGQYSRATYLVGLPVEQATTAVSRVLLPSFSRVQGDPIRLGRALTRGTGIMAGVVMIPMAVIVAGAHVIVPWVLGPGWDSAASVLPAVAIAYGLSLLTHLPAVAVEAVGAVRLKLLIQIVTVGVAVTATFVAGTSGPTLHRLAGAWVLAEVVRHVLYWVFVFPHVGLARSAVARRYGVAAALAAAGALPVATAVHVFGANSMAAIVLPLGLGALALVGLAVMGPSLLRDDLRSLRAGLGPGTTARFRDRGD